MTRIYLVQHAQKRRDGTDPALTGRGLQQAKQTGRWLSRLGLDAVFSSPLRRARQTAATIAAATGLDVRTDDRLRERMNWDGVQPFAEFLGDWARSTADRDFEPRSGDSSRRAGDRLLAFLRDRANDPTVASTAAVVHGGVTADLLRTLLGDAAVPAGIVTDGVPSCAITILDDLAVVEIASVDHLDGEGR